MTDMPPLPPPTPSIKLTLEGLATLLGLKVCSHGDLGFAFGSGPVLASHEAATITREVVANLRTRAREEGEAAESLRAQLADVTEILHRAWPEHMSGDPVQLAKMTAAAAARIAAAEVIAAAGKREAEERAASEISRMRGRIAELEYQRAETSAVLADVTEILHRAWPEHMSGDPVQLAKAAAEAIVSSEAMRTETIAEGRKRVEAARLEIETLREKLADTNCRAQQYAIERAGVRKRLGELLVAPVDEDFDQIATRVRDLLEIRDRYTAIKARAEADELEIRQLTESLRVARSAESAKAEEVDTLLKMIDTLAPELPSCVEPHSDRLAHAQRKIAAALDAVEHTEDPIELQEEPLRVSPIHELRRGSAQASGLDLPVRLGVSLAPGRTVRIPTGVQVAIPEGFEGQVRPRSSAAARGILVHLGTIDADYRGEIEVVVTNLSGEWVAIDKPIAQLVICPVARPSIEYVEKLDDTARGESGFGSSDVIASGGYTNGAMVVVGKETK